MPELPEVETIRRQLASEIVNKKIIDVEIRQPRLVKAPILNFKKNVVGAKILDIKRRAKLLIIELSNSFSLLVHLKLTGQLLIKKEEEMPEKYTHVIFYFADEEKLFFNDMRQFGYIRLVKTDELDKVLEKEEKFGPEPMEKGFTLERFTEMLAKKKVSKIKPLLMDQTFIAGLGNVYAAEACFYAGVKPTRLVGLLKEKEIKKLYEGIKKILPKAIGKAGSSVDTYLDIYGKPGRFVSFLQVYGRAGQPCTKCKTKIQVITLGGRGTYFCPKCQK